MAKGWCSGRYVPKENDMDTTLWLLIGGVLAGVTAAAMAIGKFLGMTEIDEDDEEPIIGA
jgi:hypothetical protein